MGDIWTDENRYQAWLRVEILACEALAKKGKIPKKAIDNIRKKAGFSIQRIEKIEAETKHDVIAFLTDVAEHVGPDSRYIHMGLTSSDILDTSMAYLLRQAGKIILKDCKTLLQTIKKKAFKHKNTVMIGRSHGIHAEPVTVGLKFALWYDEMARQKKRLEAAIKDISVGKISGAVGTFANIEPEIEEAVCQHLGLQPAPASSQIIQRDRHAFFFTTLALIAASIEKFATEIRHLQRTEVGEAEEFFHAGQKGSSAMPHKRNPIVSERVSGLARILRSNSISALENIALWHERDISHSSVERITIPDSCIALDYMLHLMIKLIDNLIIYPENMLKNLNLTRGLVYSQTVLLKLINKGITRETAYSIVQTAAMDVWNDKNKNLKDELLKSDEVLKYLLKFFKNRDFRR